MKLSEQNKCYTPSSIVITEKEPVNKSFLWIDPHKDYTEIKWYNKGWKVLFTSQDAGLSELSIELVNELINKKLEMLANRIANNSIVFTRLIDDLKRRVKELEDKINT